MSPSPRAWIIGRELTSTYLEDQQTLVIRNRDKDRVLALVEGRLQRRPAELPYHADREKYLQVSGGQERSRSMVKVQDGCDSHCTYCIIPRARGRSRSLAPREVVRRIRALVEEGHAEVVITGVDLGSYGEDAEGYPDLGGLLALVLAETDVERVRVSSLEPGDFDDQWLALWESPRLCRHLHVPLQAGSAGVLSRMVRSYSPDQFASMVAACRAIPDMTITTDVMVGFPGETDEEFDEGYHFIRAMAFDGMHVFKYSRRSGTRAHRMPDQVREEVKTARSSILREEAAAGVARLLDRHRGRPATVVWESRRGEISRGLTDTNVRVYGSTPAVPGRASRVRLGAAFHDGLWAEPFAAEMPLVPVGRF